MESKIDVDQHSMQQLTAAIDGIKNGMTKATRRASNRTARQGKTLISKRIREEVRIKKRDIDKHISVSTAGQTGRRLKLSKSKRLSVKYFGARQTKKGVTFKIAKKGKKTLVRGAFMGPRPGQINVKTKGNAFVRKGRKRLPIRKLLAVSPIGVVMKKAIDGETEVFLKDKFRERLFHETNRLVEQHTKKTDDTGSDS